jgi:uncharacterized protein
VPAFQKSAISTYFYIVMADFLNTQNLLVGRNDEVKRLRSLLLNKESDLVSIIGRRRVGKTFLIKQVFHNEILFQVTGIMDGSKKEELQVFMDACLEAFKIKKAVPKPKNWIAAFKFLAEQLGKPQKKKRVLFFDEMPWLAGTTTAFIKAFEHFWNHYCTNLNVLVIICGSATSWMVQHIYKSRGGMHNRVTERIQLEPFTLAEVKTFFDRKRIKFTQQEIIFIYMALGGIPFYLNQIPRGLTAVQAINQVCFGKKAILYNEFEQLYRALFKNAEDYLKIVRLLQRKKYGLTRSQLVAQSKFSTGGTLTKVLNNLEQCHFITCTESFVKTQRDTIYRLTDEFSIFYLQFVEPNKNIKDYWLKNFDKQSTRIWYGYAFENLCYRHIDAIKIALGINGISTRVGSYWQPETQIDMLIDRADDAINIIEIKHYQSTYIFTKQDDEKISKNKALIRAATKNKKSVFTTMITLNGLAENKYKHLIDQHISAEELFLLKQFD